MLKEEDRFSVWFALTNQDDETPKKEKCRYRCGGITVSEIRALNKGNEAEQYSGYQDGTNQGQPPRYGMRFSILRPDAFDSDVEPFRLIRVVRLAVCH